MARAAYNMQQAKRVKIGGQVELGIDGGGLPVVRGLYHPPSCRQSLPSTVKNLSCFLLVSFFFFFLLVPNFGIEAKEKFRGSECV